MKRNWKTWLFLTFIILFVVFVRVRLSAFPLERDEGEYAYMGQLMLQGIPPYLGAYNMKFPGTYAMYALIMSVFGQNIQGIHLGLTAVNCASVLLVFLLAGELVSDIAALSASAAYALLSLSPSVLGFAGHATHFVVLPALGGVLALLYALRGGKGHAYFWSGVLFGLAVLMKQPGLFFFLFGAAFILYHHFSLAGETGSKIPAAREGLASKLGALSLGAALPLLLTFVSLYAAGAFDKFWFWTFEYASSYGSQVPLSGAFDIFKENMAGVAEGHQLFWIMSVAGLVCTFFYHKMKDRRIFIALFTFFSFLTICPGFYFRAHYFITLLPAVSILTGIFIDWANNTSAALLKFRYAKFAGIVVFILVAGTAIASERGYLFEADPVRLSRGIYGENPFPESLEIAEFIKSNSTMDDRVAVFGSEPQIYFYSGRHSATGYIYTYGLMEIHPYALEMQKEMIREIESSQPKFIVSVYIPTSWLMRPESEKYILSWFDGYVRAHYRLVGVADIISSETTVYKWHADAQGYAIQSPYRILVFEKSGASS